MTRCAKILCSALLALSLSNGNSARADDNKVDLEQIGDSNFIEKVLIEGRGSTATIRQEGSANRAWAYQYGDNTEITVTQLGRSNVAGFVDSAGSKVKLTSTGNRNEVQGGVGIDSTFAGTQIGDDNRGSVGGDFKSRGNTITFEQTGDRNNAQAIMAGDDNVAKEVQTGSDNRSYSTQIGSGNIFDVNITGNNSETNNMQQGDANRAFVTIR